jgi:fructose-1,6-bisphosphatase/inositol monophosphatase family enzyme
VSVTLSKSSLSALVAVAQDAAVAAGRIIYSSRNLPFKIDLKTTGASLASQVVTDIDRKSEACILKILAPSIEQFDLGVLGEESQDTGSRLVKDFFWCIDPLDGTLAFMESKTGYAVSIALVSKSGEPVIGVVYEPDSQTLFSAVVGEGVFKNGSPLAVKKSNSKNQFVLPCDRSFAESDYFSSYVQCIEAWCLKQGFDGLELIHDCGAVVSACRVLESNAGCYFKRPKSKAGGGSIWDFAATACLFREYSALVCDFIQLKNGNEPRCDSKRINDQLYWLLLWLAFFLLHLKKSQQRSGLKMRSNGR